MDGNHTYLLQEYSGKITRILLPIDILCSIIILFGVIGNIFVLILYAIRMKKDQRESRYFIPILAFYDLMVCILSEIYFLSRTFLMTPFQSDELCKTLLFFLAQTVMTSDAFLLVIAIQRHIMICRPLGKQMTIFWRRISIALVIAANIAYSIPVTIVSGVQESALVYRNVTISGQRCSIGNEEYPLFQRIYYGIVIFIIVANIVVTTAMYIPIACVVYRRLRKKSAKQRVGNKTQSSSTPRIADTSFATQLNACNRQPKTNFNMMFFMIVFVYVVTSAATAVRHTALKHDYTMSSDHASIFYAFLRRMYVFNHVANPFIYAYFDSWIRSYLAYVFCKYSTA